MPSKVQAEQRVAELVKELGEARAVLDLAKAACNATPSAPRLSPPHAWAEKMLNCSCEACKHRHHTLEVKFAVIPQGLVGAGSLWDAISTSAAAEKHHFLTPEEVEQVEGDFPKPEKGNGKTGDPRPDPLSQAVQIKTVRVLFFPAFPFLCFKD